MGDAPSPISNSPKTDQDFQIFASPSSEEKSSKPQVLTQNLLCSNNGGRTKGSKAKGKGKPALDQEAQEWGMFYKGKVIALSKPTIEGIKAQSTHIMGWLDMELMEVWANIFPLTPECKVRGSFLLSDLA